MAPQENARAFDFGLPTPTFKDKYEERQYIKERLALAYRVMAHENLAEGVAGHLTSRDPVDPECFWVNPFGLHFSRMTASDLLLVDHHGKVVGGGKPGRGQIYNAAAFVIHSAIHAARPEVNSVVHAHSIYAKAFSTLGRKLPMYTQDACIFYNDHALYAKHGGVVLSSGESDAICKSIGGNKAVILQNHGLLTVGGCIESAVGWFQIFESECKSVLAAEAAAALSGKPPITLPDDVAEFTYKATGFEEAGKFEAHAFFDLVEYKDGDAFKA
ncbi:class II aldolase/adducin head domain-containing protein [Vanrija pseudolonga]|uniref:Meiotically up-regulated gene 14 protein n=1 Tax=Vanrija pseudolonga TaxID=143232 RepID=A0AAF0XYV9_9TREE|nr:Meiotically up-regulated gene 14 protein [Vanrija pseudolonga]